MFDEPRKDGLVYPDVALDDSQLDIHLGALDKFAAPDLARQKYAVTDVCAVELVESPRNPEV